MDEIEELIKTSGLEHIREELLELVLPAIRIVPEIIAETDQKVGMSKLGGVPDLPPEVTWPLWENITLSFIAQFNMEDLSSFSAAWGLPTTGILYFFLLDVQYELDKESNFSLDSYPFWEYAVVKYYDGDFSQLGPTPFPRELEETNQYPPCKLSFYQEYTLPDPYSKLIENLHLSGDDETAYNDKLWAYLMREENEPYHRLLGHPTSIQDAVLYGDERLLLQLDTDKQINMMWGDYGMIYFTIKESDFSEKDYQEVRPEYQGC